MQRRLNDDFQKFAENQNWNIATEILADVGISIVGDEVTVENVGDEVTLENVDAEKPRGDFLEVPEILFYTDFVDRKSVDEFKSLEKARVEEDVEKVNKLRLPELN